MEEGAAPEDGRPLGDILNLACTVAPRAGLNHAHGGFCAFITGGGLLHSAVADLLSASMNRYTGIFLGSPGYVQLESNVISWMAQLMGYDAKEAFGCFTSGGSMANFIGILVARRRHLSEYDLTKGSVMVTSESHSCIPKGLMMAGLPQSCMCHVACDSEWRMDPKALEQSILMEKKAGRKPFLAIATTGTTNTGTVDQVGELAKVCQRHDVWLHVDGVYGAAFNLTKRGQALLEGLGEADSISIDFHKSFFLPHGTGLVLVKKRQYLRQAFTLDSDAPYYPDFDSSDVNFYEMSPELTRSFRGMRIWLPIQLCGLNKWRMALDERLDWTAEFLQGLENLADLGVEVTTRPSLTLLTFRYVPTEAAVMAGARGLNVDSDGSTSPQQLRQMNVHLLKFINRRGHLFLSPTTMPNGTFVLRICILHLRLTKARLQDGLQDIADGVRELQEKRQMNHDLSNLDSTEASPPPAKRARTASPATADLSPPPSPRAVISRQPVDVV